MNFDDRKRKSWREESGVSEIVGNILILMITVVLFTSIMAFVNQIPIPEQQTKATFDAKITFLADGEKADLTITHTGGDSMEVQKTLILVDIGDITKPYNLTADSNFAGVAKWKINMPWKQLLDGTSYMSRIQVTVVDMIKHAVVWTSQVTGGTGGSPPNIVQRWTDSDKATATPDAVLEWDDFWFYATIDDPDGDLNTSAIWIDTHQLETDLPLGTSTVRKDWTLEGSNVYRWAFLNIQDRKLNASDLDGNLIFIHAWDEAGHESVSTFKMVVTRLPIQPVPDYPDNPAQPVGESGLPAWLTWFSEDHGFGIYAEFLNRTVNPPIPLGIADTNNPTTIFVKNTSVPYYPKVFVRFASLSMTNINTQNRFTVKDVRTGLTIAPVYTGNSTASKPFYPHPTAGGSASIYECQFSTSNLVTGLWSLGLEFKNSPASGKPQLMFNASQTIMFELEGSPMGFIPEIKVTNKPDYSGTWGERNTPFEVSSVDKFKVYVLVSVKDATYPPAPGVAEVRIVDMNGAAEVYGIPPAGAMMSAIKKLDGYTYNFSIDLRLNNGQQWKSGTNSYTLVISKLNDTNEGMYSLSLQIFITGAGSRADFFVGTTGMASGNGNFNTRLYSYYIQNNNLFTTRVLWQSESTPGASTDFTVTALAAGDVDGDGAKDLLMGQAASNELYLFQNTLATFGTWQSGSTIYRPDGKTYRISWIAFGDVNGDGHDDFAYANSNGQIVIYNTTYGSQGWIYTPPTGKGWSTPVSKIALRDMTGDGRSDLVILGGGKIYIYDLKYAYTASLIPQRNLDGKELVRYSTGATVDFDIADVNADGKLDIVTADTAAAFSGGGAGPNVNLYTFAVGTQKIIDNTYNANMGYKLDAGVVPDGGGIPDNTHIADGNSLRFQETGSGSDPSSVQATMRFVTLDNNPDQQLRLRTKIGAANGPLEESYYVWYSIDGSYFIPILTITETELTYVNYTLPSSVMGKQIYIKFTDSLTTDSGLSKSYIDIDLAGVFTDTFNGYTGRNVVPEATYTCVRAADIDGSQRPNAPYKEIVVAKNSVWAVYNWTGGNWVTTGMSVPPADATFFVSSASKVGTGYFNNLAPTLFSARDVNGDGFTDIVICKYNTTTTKNSYVGFFMNIYNGHSTDWRYFPMRQWNIDPPVGQAKDPWVDILISASLFT